MESWIRFCLCILTCYRLACMIAQDDGPLFIFKRVRYYFMDMAYREANDNYQDAYENFNEDKISDRWFGYKYNIAEGISCSYCVGVWLSIPLFLMFLYPTYPGDLFLIFLSISGGQAFLQGFRK